jgi:two-component system, LytTR family, sensor kinase
MERADRGQGAGAGLRLTRTGTRLDQPPIPFDQAVWPRLAPAANAAAMAEPSEYPSAAAPHSVPVRLVLLSAAGMWLGYYLLVTARGYVVGLEFQGELAWRRLLISFAGFLITLATWPLLRALERHRLWLRIAVAMAVMLPASLLIAAVNQSVFAEVESKMVTKVGEKQGVTIRRDESGNMLVDVPDPPASQVPAERDHDRPPRTEAEAGGYAYRDKPGKATVTIAGLLTIDAKWRQLTDIALGRYFLLIAWAALYMAFGYAESARHAERREGEYRRAAKAAELRSLRYQVNPHFLFNTLNSLSALVMTGKAKVAETMIQNLSTFYRRSLSGDPTSDVTLEEEIGLQKLYLEIEGVRFPERLRTVVEVPENLATALVPGMILQPLVENSVKYAVSSSRKAVTISITAREEFRRLVLVVADDGGASPTKAAVEGHGIGLANVADRLEARFGEEASLVSGPVPGGYRTEIRLPLLQSRGNG